MASAHPSASSRLPNVPSALNVGKHGAGLVERADHVLGLGQVDGDLAADGCVNHGGHAGWHLHEGNAPEEGGGDEAAQVAGYAAADGDDRVAALGLETDQPLVDFLGLLEGLAGFAGRDHETVGGDTGPLQGPLGVASVGSHHVFIGDDIGRVAQPQLLDVFAEAVNDAPTGDDGVAAAGVVYGCGLVGVGHCSISLGVVWRWLFRRGNAPTVAGRWQEPVRSMGQNGA